MEKYIPIFLAFKKAEGLAERTLADYARHLTTLTRHVPTGTTDYRGGVISYLSGNINPNTYNMRFKYMKVFFDWCIAEGFLDCPHPLKGLKKRRAVSRIVHIENDALEKLLKVPDKKRFAGLRDHALILFSLDSGARPGESLQLREEDFNFPALLVTIPAPVAKTRTSRTIPITIQTVMAVRALLAAHHPDWKEKSVPVFCADNGNPMCENSWAQRLRHHAAKIGEKITPYYLRHAAALGMLRSGMSVFALKDILGHVDLTMTQKYLALTLDDLRREHAEASLVNTILPTYSKMSKV